MWPGSGELLRRRPEAVASQLALLRTEAARRFQLVQLLLIGEVGEFCGQEMALIEFAEKKYYLQEQQQYGNLMGNISFWL